MADDTATATTTAEALDLKRFLSSMKLNPEVADKPVPMFSASLETINENVSTEDRFISGLAALLLNIEEHGAHRFDKGGRAGSDRAY